MTKCTAKTLQGKPCKNQAVKGGNRCHLHGGVQGGGTADPQDATQSQAWERAKAAAGEYAKDREEAAGKAEGKAQKARGALGGVFDDLMTLIRLIRAWATGQYKTVPWETILTALAGILYFLSPFDLIPDFIPGIGFLDDLVVIGFVIRALSADIENFRNWEAKRGDEPAGVPYP